MMLIQFSLVTYYLLSFFTGVEQLMITSGPAYPQQNMYAQQPMPNMGMPGMQQGMPPQGMPQQGIPNMGMNPGMQQGFY